MTTLKEFVQNSECSLIKSASNLHNAPINSKLQHPPPQAYPGHLTVHRSQGGGNLNVVFEGWGI